MRNINTVEAESQYKRGAALNAYYQNRQNAMTYTPAQQCQAQRALDILDTAFAYAESYINYRKNFIAVKIAGHIARNKNISKEAVSILEEKGYDIVSSKQGLVVRIPR